MRKLLILLLFAGVAGVAIVGSGAAFAETVGALIVPTAQTRTVSGSAYAEDYDDSMSDSDSDQALDFGPFTSGASAQAEVSTALGAGGGTQASSILSYSIVAQGSAFANGESYDFGGYGDGAGSSRFSVTFTLTAESDYTLTGSIAAFDDGFSFVSFRDRAIEIFGEFASGPAQEVPIQASGTLPPGQYTLEIEAEGSAFVDAFNFAYAFADYMITLQLAGTGPGGEVPDGKDVPGGPPLELRRLPGGDVRMSWGASCRGDDDDYAVYEGEIGDPSSLAPLTCSTGGARNYDAIPTFDGSFFVVVPTDGSSEGSYGNTSADVERAASLSACLTQLLGEPICP